MCVHLHSSLSRLRRRAARAMVAADPSTLGRSSGQCARAQKRTKRGLSVCVHLGACFCTHRSVSLSGLFVHRSSAIEKGRKGWGSYRRLILRCAVSRLVLHGPDEDENSKES